MQSNSVQELQLIRALGSGLTFDAGRRHPLNLGKDAPPGSIRSLGVHTMP